ncbi:MAG: TIGR01777 family oxidoreductase [Bacteroidota bacterium]|nr:TIGR01777 family oxidoreductase [Bacteroidota bacterium]MDP3144787.1 TIGR01777 family oxidoreductase [Bacteroidota bacterium]
MAKILITGGSGLVGNAISKLLLRNGHKPIWLSRETGEFNGIKKYKWDISKKFIDEKAFEDVESIIHLAGAGIADKRWTPEYKKIIIDSRVKSCELLFEYILKNNYNIKTLIGGSAVGYYGALQSDKLFTEEDFPGNDFLAETCQLWEKSYQPFINQGTRTVIIRTATVLSNKGGAYTKMVGPYKLGLGAALGSGKQNFPWIHINDIAGIYNFVLFNQNSNGVYNAVSSEIINNHDFLKQLAKSYNKPFFLPNIPEFILKIVMGESSILLSQGVKISNKKIKDLGYTFEFETAKEALNDLAK